MVEELLPASITVVVQVDMDKRIVLWFNGFFYKLHPSDFRSSASFFDVTGRAGTDNIFPGRFAAQAPRDDMVKGQFAGREVLAAVLAVVPVACEDVTAVKLYFRSRQAVVREQADNAGHGDVKVYG